jgi:hypothetical protein
VPSARECGLKVVILLTLRTGYGFTLFLVRSFIYVAHKGATTEVEDEAVPLPYCATNPA